MITRKEFCRRRNQLMRMMGKNSIAIIPTSTEQLRNRDVEFPFRADSDFYYLTGFREPDAVAQLPARQVHAVAAPVVEFDILVVVHTRDGVIHDFVDDHAAPESVDGSSFLLSAAPR